jgi:hypothetical protein
MEKGSLSGNFTTISNEEYKRLKDIEQSFNKNDTEKFDDINYRLIMVESMCESLSGKLNKLEEDNKILKSRCTCP